MSARHQVWGNTHRHTNATEYIFSKTRRASRHLFWSNARTHSQTPRKTNAASSIVLAGPLAAQVSMCADGFRTSEPRLHYTQSLQSETAHTFVSFDLVNNNYLWPLRQYLCWNRTTLRMEIGQQSQHERHLLSKSSYMGFLAHASSFNGKLRLYMTMLSDGIHFTHGWVRTCHRRTQRTRLILRWVLLMGCIVKTTYIETRQIDLALYTLQTCM